MSSRLHEEQGPGARAGGRVDRQGRVHHQGAGGTLHAQKVSDPEEKILSR